jgi:hypothetical protein
MHFLHFLSKKMRNRRNSRIREDAERNIESLREGLGMLRESVHAAAERPDFFWRRQHDAIMASLNRPAPSSRYRPALLWATAAVAVVLCLFFFAENSKAPTPDIAAGSDQYLLIEVERTLNQDCPDALAPAALLDREIEKAVDKKGVRIR